MILLLLVCYTILTSWHIYRSTNISLYTHKLISFYFWFPSFIQFLHINKNLSHLILLQFIIYVFIWKYDNKTSWILYINNRKYNIRNIFIYIYLPIMWSILLKYIDYQYQYLIYVIVIVLSIVFIKQGCRIVPKIEWIITRL
jgi:hypothetical protein